MQLVNIPKGDYTVGYPGEDISHNIPKLRIRIEKNISIGKYLVTQSDWIRIFGFGQYLDKQLIDLATIEKQNVVEWGPEYPAVYITKNQAIEFCQLYGKEINKVVRLPSDHEWEVACRAGSDNRWIWGNEYDKRIASEFAWYGESPRVAKIRKVGLLKPNKLGIYDMAGNVSEFVLDQVNIYDDMMPVVQETDEILIDHVTNNGEYSITRGGSVTSSILTLLSSNKICHLQNVKNGTIGFRIIVEN